MRFQRTVDPTDAWSARTPGVRLDRVPIQTGAMRSGDRVSRVTFKSLIAHIAVGEDHWAYWLPGGADGIVTLLPQYSALQDEFVGGGFRAVVRKVQQETEAAFAVLASTQLGTKRSWADREWSVMDRLSGACAHCAVDIGNIDIHLRQADAAAPGLSGFNPLQMA